MAKQVLVSYMERNKKITIPEYTRESDIGFLKKEFRENFDYGKNVKLQITFQRYDPEWEEFVDLEEDGEVHHKDKLKAIVSPLLSDNSVPNTNASTSEGTDWATIEESPMNVGEQWNFDGDDGGIGVADKKNMTSTPLDESTPNSESDEEAMQLNLPKSNRKRKRIFESDLNCDEDITNTSSMSDSGDSKSFLLIGIPSSIKKTKEDSTPLPDPFPLPTNFRPDVHICLEKKTMTKSARAAFYTAVAAAMFQYKRYPTNGDYVSVARQIEGKYPFLGAKGFGPSYEGIVQTLIDRFKDFRRLRKTSKNAGTADLEKAKGDKIVKPRKKSPGTHNVLALPEVPAGEDDVSFERHNRILRTEWSKTNRNAMLVEELMSRTFAMRRREIIDNPCDVQTLFKKFPFLQQSDQLQKELERITNIKVDEVKSSWSKWAPKIYQQARLEASTTSAVSGACSRLTSHGDDDPLVAMAMLAYLVPDSRCKPDHFKVLYFNEGSSQVENVIRSNSQRSPYLLITSFPARQVFLIVDKSVVCECAVEDVPVTLMSAFFSFNICYTPGCLNFFAFLECILLSSKSKLPASVKHLLAALNN